MIKRTVCLIVGLVMMFSLVACSEIGMQNQIDELKKNITELEKKNVDQAEEIARLESAISLLEYKIAAKEEIQSYADAKGKENYSTEDWNAICKALIDGKKVIDAVENKSAVDTAVMTLKNVIDTVERENGLNINAVMYDRAILWRNDEFYTENLTYGDYGVAYYEDNDEYLLVDELSPNSRTFIIKNQDEFEKIFAEFPQEINFETEMVVLYIFTNVYNGLPYDIDKIILVDETLNIEFSGQYLSDPPVPSASMPIVRWLAIKMNKLDITQAEFIEGHLRYA